MSKQSAIRKANDKLFDITSARYFSAIPLDSLYDAIESTGLEFDPEEKQCILCGRDGEAFWDLFYQGKPIKHRLVVTWHKMDVTRRYEVIAYVS